MGSDTSESLDVVKKLLADEVHESDHIDEWHWLFHKDPEIRRLVRERSERIHRRTMEKLSIEEHNEPTK